MNNMKTLLWLDDYRSPYGFVDDDPEKGMWTVFSPIKDDMYGIAWVKNYEEFCNYINKNGLPTAICFDNSLGDFDENGIEKTGYDCAKWLVDYCLDNNIKELPLWVCQSSEPHSRENIDKYLNNFLKAQQND